jgi:hypothetical protein
MSDPDDLEFTHHEWDNKSKIGNARWKCGYCDHHVSSEDGYYTAGGAIFARPCPGCKGLSMFLDDGTVLPRPTPGSPVTGVNPNVADLYNEARFAAGAGAFTASVMACRKLLMNIAVTEGAKPGLAFKDYVAYLEKAGMFSPKAKRVVEHIKDMGNDANHQINPKSQAEAELAIEFVGSLLRHNYEMPSMLSGTLEEVESEGT